MRSEKEMMDAILGLAKGDECIRVVTREGSRLNKNAPVDKFQDFDIAFIVKDMEKYKSNDDWLDAFGKRIIMQKPEAMPMFPPDWLGKCNKFSYLITLEDGNKIDLTLVPIDELKYYFEESDSLLKVLLDKDHICPVINEPSDIDFHVKIPSEDFVDNCCNEFWHLAIYVTKGLCRNELLYSIKHLDLMKEQMLTMISWKIGIQTEFSISVGKAYKYLDKYVSEGTWATITETYKNNTVDDVWDSLILCCNLFQETTNYVSKKLKYKCPEYNKNVANHIKQYFPPGKTGNIKIL
ncbi:MAG: aminoglycoside 6-adenylyltransferase [Tannerellaceae bacterium]|jgi:aminoglycoside 6-adenylyltransferase|nr:aminoglycoside 6-adenylyltransferase [Tannerellaceae bacterium]